MIGGGNIKIVIINENCNNGSIGRLTFELATELEKRGHNCLFAYANGIPHYSKIIKIGNNIDHKIHAVLSRLTGLQGYYSYFATKRLISALNKFQPEIVHLHNLHGNYINLKLLLTWLAKENIATVVTLHDCWFYTGKCTHYISCGCDKWKKACGKCPLLHSDNVNPTFFFDRTRRSLLDKKKWFAQIPRLAVTGVSNWISEEASKSIFESRKPVTIYNWIDINEFYPRNTNLREKLNLSKKFVIIMVASVIMKLKWYDEMVQLAAVLPDEWRIIAIGKTELHIPNNVIHIQRTNNIKELAEFYSMADVCLNTTKRETFGMVTAEAICCGTPVIVYNNTASPELVCGGCGIVVDPKNGFNGIIDALNVVYHKGKRSFTSDCIEMGSKRFKKKIAIEKFIELYKKLLNN